MDKYAHLKLHRKTLMLPATEISLAEEGLGSKPAQIVSESIRLMSTLLLCQTIHNNSAKEVRDCAERLLSWAVHDDNKRFLRNVMMAVIPDGHVASRLRQMKAADDKAKKMMKRDGKWPEWMEAA